MSGLGHLAPALMAKTATPELPLWSLLIASETNDLLYGIFTALGVEKPAQMSLDFQHGVRYLSASTSPWSHGLLMSVAWSAAAAGLGWAAFRNRKAACVLGLVTFSHWLLDFLMHANLPLAFDGSPLVGLGLETSGPGFLFMTLLDLALLGGGIALYLSSRRRKEKLA